MSMFEDVFNHLVLPPQLPAKRDADIEATGNAIVARLIQATSTLIGLASASQEETSSWLAVRQYLQSFQSLHALGRLEQSSLISAFQNFSQQNPLLLHVAEQNAALIIRYNTRYSCTKSLTHRSYQADSCDSDQAKSVIFQAFELSPPSAEVLASQDALISDFPDCSAQIPLDVFQKPGFQQALADLLEKGSMEPLRCFQALATKAQTPVVESRDAAHPGLVSHLLIPLLEAIGSPAHEDIPRVRKRIRDDAIIKDTEFPWRRLPVWTALRLGVRRQLQSSLGNEAGRAYYKFLITTLLIEFLVECPGSLTPELAMILRAKICRRIAKLEQEKHVIPTVYGQLFNTTASFFKDSIVQVTELVHAGWEKFKRDSTRRIPKLPTRADDEALILSLPNSGSYLESVLRLPRLKERILPSLQLPPQLGTGIEEVEKFTTTCHQWAALESGIEKKEEPRLTKDLTLEMCCEKLSGAITNLIGSVGTAYDSNPEQYSVFILCLFTLWMRLDKHVAKICPMILEYRPVFTPELLDALHPRTTAELQLLREIQHYLQNRFKECEYQTTIFSEPEEESFAVKYVSASHSMQELHKKIRLASQASRKAKKKELEEWWSEYDMHSSGISEGTCVCTIDRYGNRDVRGCDKCWHVRARKRMEIYAHEDFLPNDASKAASVIFELGIPKSFAKYRHVTWKIFTLAYPSKPRSTSPMKLLEKYDPLKAHMSRQSISVTIASTSKSFLGTHYKVSIKGMRASESDVLLPNGLNFAYYDMASHTWLREYSKPLTFQHQCGVHVPVGLRGSVIPASIHPPTVMNWPSSYATVASETHCPSDMSVHEFTAFQRLLAGTARRWLTMLVELGASNINFSSENAMHMFSHLATQAGPAKNGVLGEIHAVLKDKSFCDCLAVQIRKRLDEISSNWREIHCMEVMVTLSLRLYELAGHEQANDLLIQARRITLAWINRLRADVRNATGTSTTETAARYAFWAALLCRSTFSNITCTMSQDDLSTFVQATLALQENFLVDLTNLLPVLRKMLIRDMKMTFKIGLHLQRSIELNPQSISMAIKTSWSESEHSTERSFDGWKQVSRIGRWVVSVMSTSNNRARKQVVHFNFIEGHLLVDHKPLGKLPREYQESNEVKELFGDQYLRTFPSATYGMSYRLTSLVSDHEIHFGFRDRRVIVRAWHRDQLLEYIPARFLVGPDTVDLPDELITNCMHWLNLNTKCLEIRRKPIIWIKRRNDWKVDIIRRKASRRNRVSLIDPNSEIFEQISDIFRHFEESRKITIFQPAAKSKTLTVELRHLALTFSVSGNGLLQCEQFGEEIDPNQDAGTLYGLESKIILRDVKNLKRRSVITPYGAITSKRPGIHVSIRVAGSTDYAKFGIDDVVGRLSCPPEPRLLYTRARLHAYTSFVVPDPLTGLTGTEEALHILQSGSCQPWEPLSPSDVNILKTIAQLSPKRDYYPAFRRALQTVVWDENLTMFIQHDAYEGVVQKILDTSEELRVFAQNGEEDSTWNATTTSSMLSHLRLRGLAQRCIYERSVSHTIWTTASGQIYKSRGQRANPAQASNIYRLAKLFQAKPFRIHTSRELSEILQTWRLIGGFDESHQLQAASLSDIVENNVSEQWGSLVNFCRESDLHEPYALMFRLGLMSLNPNTDMDIIKTLVAFASLPTLRETLPPPFPSFNRFKLDESPSTDSIHRVISVVLPETRWHRYQTDEEEEQQEKCEAEADRLVQHFLGQWPNKEVTLDGFESKNLDVGLALEHVVREWARLHSNLALSEYILHIQEVLSFHKGPDDETHPEAWNWERESFYGTRQDSVATLSLRDLLTKPLVVPSGCQAYETLPPEKVELPNFEVEKASGRVLPKEIVELRNILSAFVQDSNPLRQQYGLDLHMSLNALEKTSSQNRVFEITPGLTSNAEHILNLRTKIANALFEIRMALSNNDDRFPWLNLGNLWPCMTSVAFLEQLRSSSSCSFGPLVKEAIVAHGIVITDLQRLERIHNALCHEKAQNLQDEFENSGHENWSPLQWPDWLLLEIDSDILIRQEQVDVAHAIIEPRSKENTVLQLNMGKGKTSCIVPMVMAVIGDGKQLSRLIVPKPLLLPTAQMIQSRLGGLVGREIRHIPFSRRTNICDSTLKLYTRLHRDMLNHRGVMLIAPEHLLSYKLSSLQHLANSKLDIARKMLDFQKHLGSICRDVLDESDVSLAVKTQLIYPSGKQTTVDGHPHRWQVAQSLLSLVKDHLPELERKFLRNIEVLKRGQGYPMIYILHADVEEDLHQRIVGEICTGRTAFLRLTNSASDTYGQSIRKVLLDKDMDFKLLERVSQLFIDRDVAVKTLLLVRGLLLNRILLLCLRKRWNVQYGLHPKRDPMAVPFEAKGIPSEQAEFGHPDAAIILTCLAFYYTGLNGDQFREALRHVLASHDPAGEYDRWTSGCWSLPEALHHWNVINVDDQDQVDELWKHLRTNESVLDHYMNHFVFPLHAKQFNVKLQASGWDLPLLPEGGPEKAVARARTTGFSGTNDNKMMLPLTIRQHDLPSLHQTNAEVLTYLLQERNRDYHLLAAAGKRLSEEGFLKELKAKSIRILIDAGAYILEMSNEDLVQKWMKIDYDALAAVYFGTDNRAWVRYRNGKAKIPLLATPFVNNLENCLVYFDEAHTRGVDLKLPQNSCGALTLALGQTKDHTVQGKPYY